VVSVLLAAVQRAANVAIAAIRILLIATDVCADPAPAGRHVVGRTQHAEKADVKSHHVRAAGGDCLDSLPRQRDRRRR
jgi:hypothetical protein